MKLSQWLQEHDARLHVTMQAVFDPGKCSEEWRCEISGFDDSERDRPATFILNNSNTVVAKALNSEGALLLAVHKLRGLQLEVILRSRDETLTFPRDLTV